MNADFARYVFADYCGFCSDWLGVQLWSKQAEALRLLNHYPRVAVRSGNGVGKTFTAALATIAYLMGGGGYAILTSSSWRGVRRSLFPELKRILAALPPSRSLGGVCLDTEWKLRNQWGAFGVSADQPENFSGFRTPRGVLVVVDEASGLTVDIANAIEGLCSSSLSKVLYIGNPLRPEGPFFESFRSQRWKTLHISTFDSPNVQAGKEVIPGLASADWVEAQAAEWGEGSPTYQARILGEFPDDAGSLIPYAWFDAVTTDQPIDRMGTTRLGVDVARQGGDRTAFVYRDAAGVMSVESFSGQDLMSTAGRIARAIESGDVIPEAVFIDDCGLGGGVTDRLIEQGYAVQPINFGSAALEKDRFLNRRAECYFRMRDALDPNGERKLRIPGQYRDILREAAAPMIEYSSRGQIKLEAKAKIRERMDRSPDLADALALTFAVPDLEQSAIML